MSPSFLKYWIGKFYVFHLLAISIFKNDFGLEDLVEPMDAEGPGHRKQK